MKRFFRKIVYRSPEIITTCGVAVMCLAVKCLAASTRAVGTQYGNGAPEWTMWALFAGWAIIGIGVFASRIRGEINKQK